MTNKSVVFKCFYALLLSYLMLILPKSTSLANELNTKHILIINSYHKGVKWSDDIVNSALSVLKDSNLDIEVSIEYMDTKRFQDDKYIDNLYSIYKHKYSNKQFDAILSTDDSAFNFLIKHSNEIFPNTPIIFSGLNCFHDYMIEDYPMFTGVVENIAIKDTLNCALSFHPNVKNIILVCDNTATGISIRKSLEELIPKYKPSINFILNEDLNFIHNPGFRDVFSKNSLILLLSGITTDYSNDILIGNKTFLIPSNFSIPIYSVWDFFLGHDILGGKVISGYNHGKIAGNLMLRVLQGESPSNILVVKNSDSNYMFDSRELAKFHITKESLPYNSIIINGKSQYFNVPTSFMWLLIICLISLFSFLILNISGRREAKLSLINSEQRLRTLINTSPSIICLKDGQGRWLETNKATLDFFNISDANWKGKTSKELSKLPGAYKERILKYQGSDKLACERGSIINYQAEFHNENSEKIIYDITKVPIFDSSGANNGLVLIGHDITAHVKAEENKKLLNEMIESENLRTEFFANISHELRTPLNVILSALQYIQYVDKNGVMEKSKDTIIRYSYIMKQNCYRLVRLVNNLIDITKIDSRYFELSLENYNITDVIEEICLSVASYIESKSLNFTFDTEVEEKIIACDPNIVERILLNLLSNAIKFTSPGGQITVNIYDDGDFIKILVKDTGIGIPLDKQHMVFERFMQVDKSLSRNKEGSGIGLSLVKSLVELHGGSIEVKSKINYGSEFIFTLPVITLSNREVKPYSDVTIQTTNEEKINIEFSDIYS